MITRLSIKNYRGIAVLETKLSDAGAIVKGGNARGKTTILNAIRAALEARDIGPDAVRLGADKAEILIDFDDLQVKRSITKKSSGLTVSKDLGGGNLATVKAPQTFLTELLGNAALDPLELFLSKPKERRATILAALPVSVDLAFLRRWAPDLPDTVDVSGHGLDVLARVRKGFYEQRAAANATEKTTAEDAKRARATADELAASWNGAVIAVDAAEAVHKRAASELSLLEARVTQANDADKRTEKTRNDIAAKRAKADAEIAEITGHSAEEIAACKKMLDSAIGDVVKCRAALDQAIESHSRVELALAQMNARQEAVAAAQRRATALRSDADALEAAVSQAAVARPSEEELTTAKDNVERSAALVLEAQDAAKAVAAKKLADELAAKADLAAKAAAKLDEIVVGLTDSAPAELLANSGGIPGLTIDGEEIALDGVALHGLSGKEQMKFAVEVARRANAKSKILVVDGLERLDPDEFPVFVKLATADGYQLIGTRVDRGEVIIEAIEIDIDEKEKSTEEQQLQLTNKGV